MRLKFKEHHLQVRPKIGGHNQLLSGDFIGWDGSEWVKADGNTVEAKFVLVEPGGPGERCTAAKGVVCITDEGPAPGTLITLGRQVVGQMIDGETLLLEPQPWKEMCCGNEAGDTQVSGESPMAEPQADGGVRHRQRSNKQHLDTGRTESISHGNDSV